MAPLRSFLLAAVLASFLCTLAAAAQSRPGVSFIRSSCRCTRYPALCERSLTCYAPVVRHSRRALAQAALGVSLTRARSASAFVGRLASAGGNAARGSRSREAGAVRDCIENVADSVDNLKRSSMELRRMGRAVSAAFAGHLNNVQTWVSAALTDQTTCLDGFDERGVDPDVRTAIRRRIVRLAQVTSNALALVNRIGAQH